MKKEDKYLLLRDICGRLPYKPKVHADDGLSPDGKGSDYTLLGINANKRIALLGLDFGGVYATHKDYMDNIKPYLRPLSSMTNEERHEIQEILGKDVEIPDDFIHIIDSSRKSFSLIELQAVFDFLNAHYFDFRGLIPKGLALEASKEMYNEIKEE